MSNVEKIIARLPHMTAKELAAVRRNVDTALVKRPGDADALRVLHELNAVTSLKPEPSAFEVTGLLSWEKHRPGESTFRAFHGDSVVGGIFKRDDHSGMDKEVYTLEILGRAVAGAFHHIRDARAAGEAEFVRRYDMTEDQAPWRP
jgi:hypothetical protein